MALDPKIMLCANDYSMDSAIFASGDQGLPELPIANVIDEEMFKPVQFTTNNPGLTWFTLDLGRMRVINMISLLKHNLSFVGKWRVRIYDDDPLSNSPIYDSGMMFAYPPISGYGGLPWGEFVWGGSTTAYADLTPSGFNKHSYCPIETVYGRYVRIDISDPSHPSGPTITRAWVSKGYQPTYNVDYGSSLDPIDETEVSKTRSGVRRYGRITKRRGLSMTFSLVPEKELLFQIFGPISLGAGKATEILALVNPADPETWFFESCFGNQIEVSKSEFNFYGHMGTTLQLDESV